MINIKIIKLNSVEDVENLHNAIEQELNNEIKQWYLNEWTNISNIPVPMTDDEVTMAIDYLRKNGYPKPEDCLGNKCPGFRPACKLDVCYVAVRLCEDL